MCTAFEERSIILVVFYALFLAVSAASGAYRLAGVEAAGGSPTVGVIVAALSFLIVFPLVLALGVVYVRVVLELVVVLFRIAENTGELVRQGKGAGGGPAGNREPRATGVPDEDPARNDAEGEPGA